jgi:predicted nucleotide-binding protein
MARINQDLLQRLASKLNVSINRVYDLIAEKARSTGHDRDIAALLVASEQGINYHKYSTPAQRSMIRGAVNPSATQNVHPGSAAVTNAPPRRPGRAKKVQRLPKARDNTVFVVHGRNEALRKSMFDFLRALELRPLEWAKVLRTAKGNNPFIGDILDQVMAKVQAVVVLFSPDDEARLRQEFWSRSEPKSEKKLSGQARPNVLFEAGLALGRHPDKTILVEVGKLRKFSDVAGRHIVRLTNAFAKRNDLANRLEKIGCKVDRTGEDWTDAGDFIA